MAPELPAMLSRFVYTQLNPDVTYDSLQDIPLDVCPAIKNAIKVFHSAHAVFFSPSDPSGVHGMRTEMIRATPSWRQGPGRYDCVFVSMDEELPGFRGLSIARVLLFMSFKHDDTEYPCALVHWFSRERDEPDPDTGMWVVQAEFEGQDGDVEDKPHLTIIHLNSIVRAAHLIPVYGPKFVDRSLRHTDTLNFFTRFFVNKFADHHANEIAF